MRSSLGQTGRRVRRDVRSLIVARYPHIGAEIARRVRSGELPAGTELLTIREYARTQCTTASTIGRAYRYLADGAVSPLPIDAEPEWLPTPLLTLLVSEPPHAYGICHRPSLTATTP
jgi:DNA-binding transcriptional MocR family regulator